MMRIKKNNIVFVSILLCVLLFIITYAVMILKDDEETTLENNQIPVPELIDEQKEYETKLDALNDLKEVRQTNAPSIYDERLLDTAGVYDPNSISKEKQRIVDSIYREGRINYSQNSYRNKNIRNNRISTNKKKDSMTQEVKPTRLAKAIKREHEQFFDATPEKNVKYEKKGETDAAIHVVVDGKQVVKKNYRLRMRLTKDATINGKLISKNSLIYGFIKFQPNRAMIEIENINHRPTKLKAFDFQDGSEGIYVENSFKGEIAKEVIGEIIDEANIPGVPQVSGVTKVFQRHNRKIKVTIINNYKLILRPR